MRKTGGKLSAGLLVSVLLIVPGAAAAEAETGSTQRFAGAPTAEACDYTYRWVFSKIRGVHKKAPGNTFKDGPGGSMTVEVRRESTIGASVSATVGASGGPPLVEIKAEVTASAMASRTVSLGHSFTHDIPRGKFGHLAYGSWAKKFSYKKIGLAERPCPRIVAARGKAVYPTRAVGWRFWATNS